MSGRIITADTSECNIEVCKTFYWNLMWLVASSCIYTPSGIVGSNLFIGGVVVSFKVGVTFDSTCDSILYKFSDIWVDETTTSFLESSGC